MKLPLYWVDAFTRSRFHGNPAAVVVSEKALAPELMQPIAAENNIAETAFVVPAGEGFSIRWFTPTVEVDLCGHATLASAFALGLHGHLMRTCFEFSSASGPLTVSRDGERLALDFPARLAIPSTMAREVSEALGATPSEVLQAAAMMAHAYMLPMDMGLGAWPYKNWHDFASSIAYAWVPAMEKGNPGGKFKFGPRNTDGIIAWLTAETIGIIVGRTPLPSTVAQHIKQPRPRKRPRAYSGKR